MILPYFQRRFKQHQIWIHETALSVHAKDALQLSERSNSERAYDEVQYILTEIGCHAAVKRSVHGYIQLHTP
eukprot:6203613-Pleurochrysis_carterae.AAC.1